LESDAGNAAALGCEALDEQMNADQHLHYDVHEGDGPYVLMVHGFLSSRAQWMLNLGALAAIARPVVVELFGHGRSPSPEAEDAYTPAAYGGEFEHIRETLGVDRWFVIGQSLGAALTLRYVLNHPERVIAHVFTNSQSALAEDGWEERVRAGMEAQRRALEADGAGAIAAHPLNPARATRLPSDVRDALAEDTRLHNPRGIALTGAHTVPGSSVRDRVHENAVPALLTAGEREERFAPYRAFAESSMPMLECVGLDAGHAVNIEAAEPWNAAVVAFLRKHR
jgi:pimeloyl-ACP methyl ester carboxylesterase